MNFLSTAAIPATINTLSQKGARPITLLMRTDARLRKRNNPFGKVRKVSVINGFLNFDYQASVNRQLEREGKEADFKTQGNWFEHIADSTRAIVRRKQNPEQLYLQVKSEHAITSKYVGADGNEIERAALEAAGVLPKRYVPKQGTDKPIYSFIVALESIIAFTCDNETYFVGHAATFENVAAPVAV